jgi:hypothetical protein
MTHLVWHSRYSDTDEPDKLNRWARILYFKNLQIGWVKRVEANKAVIFSAQTYFPVGGNDYPLGLRVFGTLQEAKDYIENEWYKFKVELL